MSVTDAFHTFSTNIHVVTGSADDCHCIILAFESQLISASQMQTGFFSATLNLQNINISGTVSTLAAIKLEKKCIALLMCGRCCPALCATLVSQSHQPQDIFYTIFSDQSIKLSHWRQMTLLLITSWLEIKLCIFLTIICYIQLHVCYSQVNHN